MFLRSKYKFILFLVLMGGIVNTVYAQEEAETSIKNAIETIIEDIVENADEEVDATEIYDDLIYLSEFPVNINTAGEQDLSKLWFLTDFQVKSLIYHRNKYGTFYTVYELQTVPGFTVDLIKKILPFIAMDSTVESTYPLKKKLKYGNHTLLTRTSVKLQEQSGYTKSEEEWIESPNSKYLGNPEKYYLRYKFNAQNKIKWGFTTEQDAGETFKTAQIPDSIYQNLNKGEQQQFDANNKRFPDYFSAHLQYDDIKLGENLKVKRVIFGDYAVQIGQGLVAWSGFTGGKSSAVMNVAKNASGIKSYGSTNENQFMRGVASTWSLKNITFTAFYSKKKIDGNISVFDSINHQAMEVSSFQLTGEHATVGNLVDKDAVNEQLYGGELRYRKGNLKTGVSFIDYSYHIPIAKDMQPYNYYEFSGKHGCNAGVNYDYFHNEVHLFGEAALSANNALGMITGASFRLSPRMSLVLLHRKYEKNYQAYYASAFAENTRPGNESGTYMGTIIHLFSRLKWSSYIDLYRFPRLRFGESYPSSGVEYLTQLDYNLSRNVDMYIKLKHEVKDLVDEKENYQEKVSKFRWHLNVKISDVFTLASRFAYARYEDNIEISEGFMIYQDIKYSPGKLPLSFAARYAVFNTQGWNSRLYTYENDVLYGYSIPALYDKGYRTYFLAKYTISKNIDLWLRWAQTYYSDKDLIGSGLNQINGNKQSEIKLQLRMKI